MSAELTCHRIETRETVPFRMASPSYETSHGARDCVAEIGRKTFPPTGLGPVVRKYAIQTLCARTSRITFLSGPTKMRIIMKQKMKTRRKWQFIPAVAAAGFTFYANIGYRCSIILIKGETTAAPEEFGCNTKL